MNWRIVRTIFFKELLDTFRDKRTLIAMIGVPIVLYPVLFIVGTQVTIVQQTRIEGQTSRLALTGDGAAYVREWLADAEGISLEIVADSVMEALAHGDIDAVVEAPAETEGAASGDGTAQIVLHYDGAEARSRAARDRVGDVLNDVRARLIEERLERAGLAETFARPLEIESKDAAPPAKSTGSVLGTILPLIMVVMLGVGAFYPAVDLTAGEKERGTFETLLSTPVSKLEIVCGKFLTVFMLSIVTGTLNLASMIATVLFQLSQFFSARPEQSFELTIEIPPQTALTILLVLIPLAFFIAAVMMTVALVARSFREAQNYVSPFFIAIVLPAGAPSIPGVELDRVTQFIPIANVSLLCRDLLMGTVNGEAAFFVFVSTAVYALLALVVAAWMFQREDVVLSQEAVAPLTWDRANLPPSQAPTPGVALGIFGVVMLLIFYAGTALQGWRLHAGLALTQYAVILLPVLFAIWYGKFNARSTLNLRMPTPMDVAGTAFVALAWPVLMIEIGFIQSRFLKVPEEFAILSEKLFDIGGLPGGVFMLLLIVAVSPAICEEALFRGVLLSALRGRLPAWATVLGVGLLFGAFHLSFYRLVPTALSGIVFTYLVLRTGSIVCSAVAHFALNGLAILLETENLPGSIVEPLKSLDPATDHVPAGWLAIAFVAFAVGIAIVELESRRKKSHAFALDDGI
jgi:sodium transport system permease protein